MKKDYTNSDVDFFWGRLDLTLQVVDLQLENRTFELKRSDVDRAEEMAEEMQIPPGHVAGLAGHRLMSRLQRKDVGSVSAIEQDLVDTEDELVSKEERKGLSIQAMKVLFVEIELYCKLRKVSFMAFWRKALKDFWNFRRDEAKRVEKKKEM